MPSPFGQTGYRHDDYRIQREFERKGKHFAAVEKQIQAPVVQSTGGSSAPATPEQKIFSYGCYWEETQQHAIYLGLPLQTNRLETNRNAFGGWIPVSVHDTIPDVIYDNEQWGRWLDNQRYTVPDEIDALSTVINTKDLFYFYPSKAGTYHVDCKVILDVFRQLATTTCITGISNIILIMLKDTYANLTQYEYYSPMYKGDIVAGSPSENLSPQSERTYATYSILDADYRYNKLWLLETDCPLDTTKHQIEAINKLLMRPKILVEGSTNVFMDVGDVLTFWYKFDSSSATGGGANFQNVQYNTIGIRQLIERVNIDWVSEHSWDNGARPNGTLEEFIKNYNL